MELDDFKSVWRQLDQRLDKLATLESQRMHADGVERARRRLRPLWLGQVVQVIGGAVLVMLAAGFWSSRREVGHLLACGLVLHAYGLLLILSAARHLALIGQLDYGEPVVTIQRRLAALRAWRLRVEAPVFGALGCFVWIPFLLVLFDGLWGVDLWTVAPGVVWIFIASGFACLLVLLGVIAWSRRPGRERFAAALARQGAGGSMWRAQAALDEVSRFERD